jgi:hypothetical protein
VRVRLIENDGLDVARAGNCGAGRTEPHHHQCRVGGWAEMSPPCKMPSPEIDTSMRCGPSIC